MGVDQGLPTPGAFVDDNLVDLYGTTIDQLISDFGRPVVYFSPPQESGCPNCEKGFDGSSQGIPQASNPFPAGSPFNRPFATGGFCPVCNGTHKILTEVSCSLQTSIQRAPKDFEYTQYGKDFDPGNVVKLKNKLIAFELIKTAEKAIVDGDSYTPIRYPLKTGLRDLRYVQSWWMRIDI